MKSIMSFLFYGAIALVIFFLLYSLAGAVIELVAGRYISAAYNGVRAFEHAFCLAFGYVAYQIGGRKDD